MHGEREGKVGRDGAGEIPLSFALWYYKLNILNGYQLYL